jgi:curli biogenesis system outer membrane secretion channel CsgG
MKNFFFRKTTLALLSAALLPLLATAQDKSSIAISSVKPTPSVAEATKPDKKTELNRIVESLDSQLVDRVNATRKFDVVGRSDLSDVLKEQELGASGNVDAKTAAKAGKLTGAKYLLVATVDDFQDYVETATFEGTGRSASKRILRMSIVGKIYDSSTGKLLESVNIQTGNDAFKAISSGANNSMADGNLTDEMMVALARNLAENIANRLVDVIFPAKVIARRDKVVTINRGEGAGVAVGDVFNVFALGEEMIDPDTKESLGREEVKVGKVKISEVNPKFSKADIMDDPESSITTGAVLRRDPVMARSPH